VTATLAAMYQDRLLAEYRAPKNRRVMSEATGSAERKNPVCGDAIRVMVRESDGRVDDVSFAGQGCSIAVASASLLTQVIPGADRDEARTMIGQVESMLAGAPATSLPVLLAPLRGAVPFKGRHGCVLMPWLALRDALG